MKKLSILGFAVLLTSCTPSPYYSNENGGVLNHAGVGVTTDAIQQAADAQCARYGKQARIVGVDIWNGAANYDCITALAK